MAVDEVRLLATRALGGLSHDPSIRAILAKLDLGRTLSEVVVHSLK